MSGSRLSLGRSLLRRLSQPMAVRHEPKHEWPSTAILPQRYRPVPVEIPGDLRRSKCVEHQAPKNTRLENTSRSFK